MLSIYDPASRVEALRQPLAPGLRHIIDFRLAQAEAHGLIELTHIVVIETEDNEAMITNELGFSLLVDPVSQTRFGMPSFQPWWDSLRITNGWAEIVATIGNAGFAYIFLIESSPETWSELLRMCHFYCP